MAENSKIGWTDHTFNPWMGCQHWSDGCLHCYAETDSKRRGRNIWGPPSTTSRHLTGPGTWREPLQWDQAARAAGVRAKVFCASYGDVFEEHPDVVNARERLWELVEETTNLDWLLLTKRTENIVRMVPPDWTIPGEWPSFVWIGTSVEHQKAADQRLPVLLEVPAAVRFLSCEPLLGPVDLTPWLDRLQWVIVGGESGLEHRAMDIAWLKSIVEQCQVAGVPVFVKQDSGLYPGRQGRIRDELWIQQFPTVSGEGRARVNGAEYVDQGPSEGQSASSSDTPWQLFDELDDDVYQKLKADIRERGVLVPVEVDEHGTVLDGHHRVAIWHELKAEGVILRPYPVMVRGGMTDDQKRRHVLALNVLRRHLTGEARAQVIRELRADGMTLQAIADAAGVSVKTVHRDVTGDPELSSDKSEPGTITNARGQRRPTRYRPRAVPPVTVFATSRHQQVRAGQAIQTGSLNALPGITVMANHPAVTAGAREYRRATEAAIERPPAQLHLDGLRLAVADALHMPLDDGVIDEILTSCRYGLEKPYRGQTDLAVGWVRFMEDWLAEAFRVLRSPGRLILNVPMDTAKPYCRPTWPQACMAALKAGFTYRSVIWWDKRNSTKGAQSLGSQESANAPYPVAEVEAIGLFSKGPWKLEGDRLSDMTHDEWQAWGNGVWQIPGESRGWEGHPAPFPEKLVDQLIRYLTRRDDVVLDPFCGSGTAPLVALQLGRRAIGFDIDEGYVESSRRRIARWLEERGES